MSFLSINSRNRQSVSQLFRFGLIGIANNLVAYLAYLLITYQGGTPKLTMSVLYVIAALVGYLANRRLTFSYNGGVFGSGLRYIIVHCLGYLINLTLLYIMVDRLGFLHQWVQIFAIFIVSAYLFIAFKLFVFKD